MKITILALTSVITASASLIGTEINDNHGGGGGEEPSSLVTKIDVIDNAEENVASAAVAVVVNSRRRPRQSRRRRTNNNSNSSTKQRHDHAQQQRRLIHRNNDVSSSAKYNPSGGKNYQNAASSQTKKNKTKKPVTRQLQTQRKTTTFNNNINSAPGCGPNNTGTHHSPYLGCYADKLNSRAFPYELHANMSRSKRLGHGALDCERECSSRNYKYFGREFKGQCFCGNDLNEIVQYGKDSGCDCCGGNVGAGKMCVWENANHPDSQAEVPKVPAILPQSAQPQIQPMHSHLSSSSNSNNHNHDNINRPDTSTNNNQIATTTTSNTDNDIYNKMQQHQEAVSSSVSSAVSTSKPIGAFRLRLHWQRGYYWQNSSRERFWCMECRGSCSNGASIQIDTCSKYSMKQKFIAIGKTIRPASNPALCFTIDGMGGTSNPVKLKYCNNRTGGGSGNKAQNFHELKSHDKFELQPQAGLGSRCLSQHHHPKRNEVVFPEKCEKTRRHDTTYWKVY